MRVSKGHGTENDFLIIPSFEELVDLPEKRVQRLCDRRAGLGADGVLRVVRAGQLLEAAEIAEVPAGLDREDWFMDYRNADGSVAEMCGNGTRVFAHWLSAHGLVDGSTFNVGTRAGTKEVTVHAADATDATVSVQMGEAKVLGVSTVQVGTHRVAGLGVDVGNPHLAAVVPGLEPAELAEWELDTPTWDTEFFPAGVNVEIVTPAADGEVHMRVVERGVGETRSCGTGTVAAARAALADAGRGEGTVRVHVPGGTVEVTITDGGSVLTGPSRIVADGETSL